MRVLISQRRELKATTRRRREGTTTTRWRRRKRGRKGGGGRAVIGSHETIRQVKPSSEVAATDHVVQMMRISVV